MTVSTPRPAAAPSDPVLYVPNGDGVPSSREIHAETRPDATGAPVVHVTVTERTNDAEGDEIRRRVLATWTLRADACTPLVAEAVQLVAAALVSPRST